MTNAPIGQINFDFATFVLAHPDEIHATKLTPDLCQFITKAITYNANEPNNTVRIPGELGSLQFFIGASLTTYLLGTRGPQELEPGDWIVIHPDSRNYILTDLQFSKQYCKVTPRVQTIGTGRITTSTPIYNTTAETLET